MQQYFAEALICAFPEGMRWNGEVPGDRRLANNISVSFPGLSTDAILMNLDLAGIAASGGSACTTGLPEPSHVILAMTGDAERARGTVRFTPGWSTTDRDIDAALQAVREILGE